MGINQTYAVFGLGRYGMAIAKELVNNGAEGGEKNDYPMHKSACKVNHFS